MDITGLITNNYSVLIMTGILVWYIFTDNSFDRYTLLLFKLSVVGMILLFVADALNLFYESQTVLYTSRYFEGIFYYGVRGLMPYFVFTIARFRTEKERTAGRFLWLLPAIVNILLCISSYWTHLIWWFDDANGFHRGILNIVPFAVAGFYLMALIFRSIIMMGSNKSESALLFIIFFINVLSTVLETVFQWRMLIVKSTTISIFVYYLFLYTQTYNRDALTNVYNRRRFYLDAKSLQHGYFSVVSMDMNGLKQINDTWGHHAGDKALIACCSCMRKALPSRAKLYRIGGDEFVVLAPKMTKKQIGPAIQTMQENLSQAGYTVACGIAEYQPGDDFEKVLTHSDQRMYQAKAMMKARESLETAKRTERYSDSLRVTAGRMVK
ncbi:MAG: GGDEF domain-containing protein [Treponemataceae bacterium]|nr:GGDEF domain-containing protein [Treponemataceae bacterium]